MAETGESFGGYRALLRTSEVELLGEGRAPPGYPEPVAVVLDRAKAAISETAEVDCKCDSGFLQEILWRTE